MRISFVRNSNNKNLNLKSDNEDKILISKIFVDDIIFGGLELLCKTFFDEIRKEFEASMFGETKIFIEL